MQFTTLATFLAVAVVGIAAAPGGYGPPPPPPPPAHAKPSPPPVPVVINQENTCSSGSPFCCSPTITDGSTGAGTTCSLNVGLTAVQCNTITICCDNNANDGPATQNCGGANTLSQPVVFNAQIL